MQSAQVEGAQAALRPERSRPAASVEFGSMQLAAQDSSSSEEELDDDDREETVEAETVAEGGRAAVVRPSTRHHARPAHARYNDDSDDGEIEYG